MFYRSKCIALNVIPSEWYDVKCSTVLSVWCVKCMRREVGFLENWREFLEGGMKKRFLSKKGNHPPPSGHRATGPSEEEEHPESESRNQKAESRNQKVESREQSR